MSALGKKREVMGMRIVRDLEGRYQSGRLQVYKLPAGDGGGSYEIAGINERYHNLKARELCELIQSGKHVRAEAEAAAHIIAYTGGVTQFFAGGIDVADSYPQIEFLLRDTAFNRGLQGAATVLQLSLGTLPVDGVVGPRTKAAFWEALQKDPASLARAITAARETYERTSFPWKRAKRDETSKFWTGLKNRWAKAHRISESFV